jgi:hypothetical protein
MGAKRGHSSAVLLFVAKFSARFLQPFLLDQIPGKGILVMPILEEAMILPTPSSNESELHQRAKQLLANQPYRCLQTVNCEYSTGSLILRGRLPTIHLIELTPFVRIDNRIEVAESTH